jgi:hypothetical protein
MAFTTPVVGLANSDLSGTLAYLVSRATAGLRDGRDSTLFHTGLKRFFRASRACDQNLSRPKPRFLISHCFYFIFYLENTGEARQAAELTHQHLRTLM